MKFNTKKSQEKQKERDKKLIKFKEGKTLMEVGKHYSLTRQRVWQIIKKDKNAK